MMMCGVQDHHEQLLGLVAVFHRSLTCCDKTWGSEKNVSCFLDYIVSKSLPTHYIPTQQWKAAFDETCEDDSCVSDCVSDEKVIRKSFINE